MLSDWKGEGKSIDLHRHRGESLKTKTCARNVARHLARAEREHRLTIVQRSRGRWHL